MSVLRYLASRPTAALFWILMGVDRIAIWAAGWMALITWRIRGRAP